MVVFLVHFQQTKQNKRNFNTYIVSKIFKLIYDITNVIDNQIK